jgi:phosphohistidine phosphatase
MMKHLTILRHAKSDWGDPNLDDFNRPLNDRGWKSARRMGKELKERGMRFDLVIASPAARVRETLDGLREKFEMNVEIRFEPRMYGASEQMLLTIVRALDEKVERPLLVGHNPGLERLLVELTEDDKAGLRDRIAGKYPTGALGVVELPAHRWADVEPGSGQIAQLILPKDLD